jgi:tetratricopeptide (TPR) repeat protein
MSYDFAVHNFAEGSAQYRALGRQVATSAHNCPILEDLGLMEANAGNFASAINYFGQTRLSYAAVRDDILRVILEEADAWNKQKKAKRGLDLIRSALRIAADAPAASLHRNAEQELRSALATLSSSPKQAPRSC